MPSVLTSEEREKSLQPLLESKDWKLMDGKDSIEKTYKFKNFNQAFGFMTRVAMASEKLDHHPDWSNVYNTVTVQWTTHCSGGITANDVKMATFCDNIFAKF